MHHPVSRWCMSPFFLSVFANKHVFLAHNTPERSGEMSKDTNIKKTRNVSGSFQVVNDSRKKDIAEMNMKNEELDEESMYYARLFMEE
jgi:hypothetical protein